MKETKTILYHLLVTALLFILAVVVFYTFFVHIPYYNHERSLSGVCEQLVTRDQLTYDDYFYEYNGASTYYIVRVKEKEKQVYLAYSEDLKLIGKQKSPFAKPSKVIKKIKKSYDVTLEKLDVAYENNIFVYYGHYQDAEHLYYFYYSLNKGEFIKSYTL